MQAALPHRWPRSRLGLRTWAAGHFYMGSREWNSGYHVRGASTFTLRAVERLGGQESPLSKRLVPGWMLRNPWIRISFLRLISIPVSPPHTQISPSPQSSREFGVHGFSVPLWYFVAGWYFCEKYHTVWRKAYRDASESGTGIWSPYYPLRSHLWSLADTSLKCDDPQFAKLSEVSEAKNWRYSVHSEIVGPESLILPWDGTLESKYIEDSSDSFILGIFKFQS